MSLINKMLQDIENRRSKDNGQEEAVMSSLNVTKSGGHSRHLSHSFWLLLVLCLAVLISVFGFLHAHAQKTNIQKVSTSHANQPTQSNAKAKDNLDLSQLNGAPAVLQNMIVVPESNQSVVQLTLTQQAHYQLQVSDNHQKLELVLANTSLSKTLPVIQPDNIITSVDTSVVNKALHITIQVTQGSEVASLSYNEAKPTVLSLVMTNPSALQQQGTLQKSVIPMSPNEIAMSDYQKALQLASNGQVNAATSLLEQALIIKHDLVQPREALIIILLQQRHIDEANQYIADGLKQMPNYIPYLELKARALMLQGSNKEALYVLQQQSPLLNDYPNYYALMAVLQQRVGNASKAVQLYSQLVAAQSNDSRWWLGLGYALESDSRPNAAVEAYRRALDIGSLDAAAQGFVTGRIQQLGG